jgi:hypothetical protein
MTLVMRVELRRGGAHIGEVSDGGYNFSGSTITLTITTVVGPRPRYVYVMRPGEFARVLEQGDNSFRIEVDE